MDEDDENTMTEIARFAVPEMEVTQLEAETALNELENHTHQLGQQMLRQLLHVK